MTKLETELRRILNDKGVKWKGIKSGESYFWSYQTDSLVKAILQAVDEDKNG